MTAHLRRLHRDRRGSALVELAIALPVMLLVFFGTVDFARVMYLGIELTNAARAGAQYGAHNLTTIADTPGIEATAAAASPNIGTFTTSVSGPDCFCASNSATFTSTACTATCSAGLHQVVTVTVTTSKTFTRLTMFPGIPSTISLTRNATMRVAN
jgi:Flp pilus assembly protein TadG